MTDGNDSGIIRRTMPPWSIVQMDAALHVELGADAQTADLEKLLDALGEFSHGFTSASEIVFHLPDAPLSAVANTFLHSVAETIRKNGMTVRFDPESDSTPPD